MLDRSGYGWMTGRDWAVTKWARSADGVGKGFGVLVSEYLKVVIRMRRLKLLRLRLLIGYGKIRDCAIGRILPSMLSRCA